MELIYKDKVNEWIEANKEEIINLWLDLCRTPAIESEPAPGAPFGVECAKALRECTDAFKNRGFDAELYEDRGYSLVSYGKGDTTIGLFCHSDVVPVGEDWIHTQPFEPILKDGALIGRGVEDNKSGIMASLCLMEILRKYDIPLKSRLQLFIGSNEETGMADLHNFVQDQPMPKASIIPDAEFPCSTGEKGICHFWAKSGEKFQDISAFYGGEAFNVVLDKATAQIKHSKALEDEIFAKVQNVSGLTATVEGDKIKLVGKGIAKHASLPEGSVNAAQLVAEFVSNLENICESDRNIMKTVAHILSCPFGTSLGIDYTDDLFGRLTFVNGMVKVEEGFVMLSFDMRYSSLLDSDKLVLGCRKAFEDLGWSIDVGSNMAGFSIDPDSKIPEIFEGIYKAATGIEKKSFKLGGGTYARFLKNAFSVGTFTELAERKAPKLEMPAGHGGAHQCDEMIDLEEFFAALLILVHYVVALDKEIN